MTSKEQNNVVAADSSDKVQVERSARTKDHGWSKSLESFPILEKVQTDKHKEKSGKRKLSSDKEGKPIEKTVKKWLEFKEERYLDADDIYTRCDDQQFYFKAKCRASMAKREVHGLTVSLEILTVDLKAASCNCKAGKSSYCNHIMALQFEIADNSLYGMDAVPEEKSCISRARNWGIPGEKDFPKEPIMSTSVQRQLSRRGINPTLYDPRSRDFKNDSRRRVGIMKETLQNVNQCIGFARVIPPDDTVHKVETKFGMNPLGSVLSYQLSPVEFNFQVHIDT